MRQPRNNGQFRRAKKAEAKRKRIEERVLRRFVADRVRAGQR